MPRPKHLVTLEVSRPTVELVRKAFATRGLEAALQRKRWSGPSRRKLDGAQEAQLAALACSPPPEGHLRWSLALLADKLVELKVVDSIARDTIRVALKKRAQAVVEARMEDTAQAERWLCRTDGRCARRLCAPARGD
jgi:hypothetical protein